jgi:bifunctional non-homologous end joining protein LigD
MGAVCRSSRSFAGATMTSACSCGRSTCLRSTAQDLRREPIEVRKATLASVLRSCRAGLQFNQHVEHPGDIIFRHACKMGLEGIVSKRLGSRYISGRSRDWLKFKNPSHPAVQREFEEDWGKTRRR